MACFIIAEAGVNHNGSEELALRLVEMAAAAGADAVKFQTFQAENLVGPGTEKAAYQRIHTGDGDQFSMLRALELQESAYARLHERCQELGIEFMSTPFDPQAADMLIDLGVKRIKVSSGELTNLPFIEFLATKDLPLIISTGMATLNEVGEAVDVVRTTRERNRFAAPIQDFLTLLHCTSNYPVAPEDVNLRAMQTLKDAFGVPVGYSDHTIGTAIPIAAVALGAVVVEKHFTLDRSLPGPDHQASLEPAAFAQMVSDIRVIECGLGSTEKTPCQNELPIRDLVRRSVALKRLLDAGEIIRKEDLALLRPGNGIPPKYVDKLIGMRARSKLAAGVTLQWSDVES